MIFGTSGHPLNTRPYNANGNAITYDMQADLLKKIGAEIYRIDVSTNEEGRSTNHGRFLDILSKFPILPMVYDRIDYEATDQQNYDIGFKQLQGFVTNYGGEHIELGNELTLFDKLKNGTGPGDKESHYHLEKVNSAISYMKGAYDGIRSVSQSIRILTPGSAGFFPIILYDKILQAVPFDILSWHVYDEMPGAYKKHFGIDNILDYLEYRYKLPIWITETGVRYRNDETQEQNEDRQLEWHKEFFAMCLDNPSTEAYIHHDLLDMVTKRGWEGNYGLFKFDGIDMTEENPDYVGTINPKKLALYLMKPEETTVKITGISWDWKDGLTVKFVKI